MSTKKKQDLATNQRTGSNGQAPGPQPPPGLVDDGAVKAELATVSQADNFNAGMHEFPYEKLSPRGFELLLFSLFANSTPPRPISANYDHVRVLNEGADRGRDVVLYKNQRPAGVVQCKRYDGNISLPEVFREIIGLILFSILEPALIAPARDFEYILAVASGFTENAGDLFSEQQRVLDENDSKMENHVQDVIDKFKAFEKIDCAAVLPTVRKRLREMKLRSLAETDLNLWLDRAPDIAKIFFKVHMVVDSERSAIFAAARAQQVNTEEFARWVTTASNSARRSAQIISNPRPGEARAPVRLDSVYVTRAIEQEISAWIDRYATTGGIIAVIGPAGHGKTSLFWRIQTQLTSADQGSCIAFPPTEMFRAPTWPDFPEATKALSRYIQDRSARDLRTYVLFDTFDLLTHDDLVKDTAMAFIETLVQAGAIVLLTSRPDELGMIPLEDISDACVRLFIQKYDLQEFTEAAGKYCQAYYGSSWESSQIEKTAARLVTAVIKNRPIREVCLSPLTLRMLFEIYAPHAIPENANAFDVYGTFWLNKVQSDARNGVSSKDRVDLSQPIMAIAEQMLGAGVPSLAHQQVNHLVAIRSFGGEVIAELFNRNLLITSPSGSIEFFHQTFFEYSAARAIVLNAEFDLAAIEAEIQEHKEKHFLLPVYEQVLLICAETKNEYREQLDCLAHRFIQDDHPALVNCAIYLHMFSTHGFARVVEHLTSSIARLEKPLLRRYVQFLSNLKQNRAAEVAEVLRAAWAVSNWDFAEPAMNLLAWLSKNDWRACKKIMEELGITSRLFYVAPITAAIERSFVEILSAGLETDPNWVGDQILGIRARRRFHPVFLDFFASHPSIIKAWDANKIESLLSKLSASYGRSGDETIGAPAARLLATAWAQNKIADVSDLAAVRNVSPERLPLILRALAEPQHVIPSQLLSALASEFPQLDSGGRLFVWLNSFYYPVLAAPNDANIQKRKVVLPACEALLEQFATVDNPSIVATKFFQRLFLTCDDVDPLVDKLRSHFTKIRLSSDSLIALIPIGIYLELPEAISIVRELSTSAGRNLNIRRLTGATKGLLRLVDDPPVFALSTGRLDALLDLVLACRDVSPLLTYLRLGLKILGADDVRKALAGKTLQLKKLQAIVLDSSYHGSRAQAYELLALLMEMGAIQPLTMEQIADLVSKARDMTEKLEAASLAAQTARAGELDAGLGVLLDLGLSLPLTKQGRIIQALHRALLPEGDMPSKPLLDRITEFGFRKVDNEPRAHLLGKVVLAQCQACDYDKAHEIALRLLQNPEVRAFGQTQKRTLAHHLDKTFQRLFNGLRPEQIKLYIKELGAVDAHLGRLIVIALCKCRRPDSNVYLQSIVELPKLSADLKRVVQDYRRFGLTHA